MLEMVYVRLNWIKNKIIEIPDTPFIQIPDFRVE